MEEMKISCYATTLALNCGLVEIEKDKGLDYAEDCSHLLAHTYYYLNDAGNYIYPHGYDLPAFTNAFKDAVRLLPSSPKHEPGLEKYGLDECAETIIDYATQVSSESWVSKWGDKVTRHFKNYSHLVAYAQMEILERLDVKEQMGYPTVVISASLPFCYDPFYDPNNDALVFTTTGLKPRPQLYVNRSDREYKDENPYFGLGWPLKYPKMVYVISHEVAHRCVHRSLPESIDSYLHEKRLEDKLCDLLAFYAMLKRAHSDRKLTKREVFNVFCKEFGPQYISTKKLLPKS